MKFIIAEVVMDADENRDEEEDVGASMMLMGDY